MKYTDYLVKYNYYYAKTRAEMGNKEGYFALGCCHRDGRGTQVNYQEAFKCFRIAAEQGHDKAQCNLGVCYRDGQGVERNLFEAYYWFYISVLNDNKYTIRLLMKLEKELNAEYVTRIQHKAMKWLSEFRKNAGLSECEEKVTFKKNKYYFGVIDTINWTKTLESFEAAFIEEAISEFHSRLRSICKESSRLYAKKYIVWKFYRRSCIVSKHDYDLQTKHGTVQYFLMDEKQAYYLNKATGLPKKPKQTKSTISNIIEYSNGDNIDDTYTDDEIIDDTYTNDEMIDDLLFVLGDYEDWDPDYQDRFGDAYKNYGRDNDDE